MSLSADKKCDSNEKITVYEFDTVNNNNGDLDGKRYKEVRAVKDKNKKFRMERFDEGASLFMQFVVLFDRNFKASSRNAVILCIFFLFQSIYIFFFFLFHAVLNLCTNYCTFVYRADFWIFVY